MNIFLRKIQNKSKGLYYLTILSVFTALGGLLFIAVSTLTSNTKVFEASSKTKIFAEAIYWEYRAFKYDGVDKTGLMAPHKRLIGTIEGFTKDLEVIVTYAKSGHFEVKTFPLADLKINGKDQHNAGRLINRYKNKTVYLDIYENTTNDNGQDVVVVWVDNAVPLNLELINSGYAEPIETPPTNIVNILMAAYYWRLLK